MAHAWGVPDGILVLRTASVAIFVFFAFFSLFSFSVLSDAAAVMDVYRMIQYDIGGSPFGCRRSALNFYASSSGTAISDADLARAVIVMPVNSVDFSLLDDIINGKKFVGGLFLVLPRSFGLEGKEEGDDETESDALNLATLSALEELLVHSSIPAPIYFGVENAELRKMMAEVVRNDARGTPASATNGGYKLVVAVSEAKKLQAVTLPTLQGWLYGQKREGGGVALPTIAIVAFYDTFGVAPSLSVGSDSNASGVVALLELLRLFSRLYSSPSSRPSFNLLFALTPFGPINFDGTKQWLSSLDQRLLENVEFALCLNSIASWSRAESLILHASRPLKDTTIKALYESLEEVAGEQNVPLQFVHKKINISDTRVAWEHEQFSRSRVVAATLSSLHSPPLLFHHSGSLIDRRNFVKSEDIVTATKIVAEALARHIFGLHGRPIDIFAEGSSLMVSREFVGHWISFLSRSHRVAPFLSQNDPVIVALQKELATHAEGVEAKLTKLDPMFVFYNTEKALLSIHQVASVTFDLIVLLAVGAYLSVLYVSLHIITKGLDDFIGVFRRPPPRKSKSS